MLSRISTANFGFVQSLSLRKCELSISSSFTAEGAENAEALENPGVEMRSFFEEEIKDKEERLKTKLRL